MEACKTAALVLAAGQGKRMKSRIAKQYLFLNGMPVVVHAIKAFEDVGIDRIILVTGKDQVEFGKKEIVEAYGLRGVSNVVAGGKERYDSVYQGLLALQESGFPEDGVVLIHDGARPLVTGDMIRRTIRDAKAYSACVAAVPAKDTIKIADEEEFCAQTPERRLLWQIQTPQGFRFSLILQAYETLFASMVDRCLFTDDAMVVEKMTKVRVKLTMGDYANLKVTTPEDMVIAEALKKAASKEYHKDF